MNARNVGRPPRGGASRGRAPAAVPPSAGAGSGAAAGESPPAGRGRSVVPRAAGLFAARARVNVSTRLPAPGGCGPSSGESRGTAALRAGAGHRRAALPQGEVLLYNGWWLLGAGHAPAGTSVVRGRTRSLSARPPVFPWFLVRRCYC